MGGQLFILVYITFASKNDVPMMFYGNFYLLKVVPNHEWVHQNSTNQPYINKENGDQIELIIQNVLTIFHINYWKCNKNFWCRGLKLMWAMPEKNITNFF